MATRSHVCECGGPMRYFASAKRKLLPPASRFMCRACGRTATVCCGVVSAIRGRPSLKATT